MQRMQPQSMLTVAYTPSSRMRVCPLPPRLSESASLPVPVRWLYCSALQDFWDTSTDANRLNGPTKALGAPRQLQLPATGVIHYAHVTSLVSSACSSLLSVQQLLMAPLQLVTDTCARIMLLCCTSARRKRQPLHWQSLFPPLFCSACMHLLVPSQPLADRYLRLAYLGERVIIC